MKTVTGLVVLTASTIVLLSGLWDALAQQKTLQPQFDWRTSLAEATNLAREMEKNFRTRELAKETETELQSIEKTMLIAEKLIITKSANQDTLAGTASKLNTHRGGLENLMLELQKRDQQQSRLYNLISKILKVMRDMESAIIQNIR